MTGKAGWNLPAYIKKSSCEISLLLCTSSYKYRENGVEYFHSHGLSKSELPSYHEAIVDIKSKIDALPNLIVNLNKLTTPQFYYFYKRH